MTVATPAKSNLDVLQGAGRVRGLAGPWAWTDEGLKGFLPVLAQVTLVASAIFAFQIESPVFHRRVMPIALAAFVVHHFVPRKAQLGVFLAASLAAIVAVLGVQAAWLVGIGAALICLCHLPIAFRWRVTLVLLAALLLGLGRGDVVPVPWSVAVWPVLGSMFMFRLVAYMYDLRHQKEPVEWTRAFAYFFLLPNVAFPLFPVVDYATFRRTWFDRPALTIYREGIAWMLRGVVHLLVYRLVYERLTLSPRDVHDMGDYVQYAVANFGLYLRVSGQFHLIVGMLHLFGFRLPETHLLFYLAHSFSDFWRRINIYWKDFMMKVVFYPTFFASRKHGERTALVAAVVAVFVVSWFTHSWQWYWILGEWLFSATDATFWALFGAIMVYASLSEARRGRARQLGTARPTWRVSLRAGLGSVGVFAFICALWTLWNSPGFAEYLETLQQARVTAGGVGMLAGVLLCIFSLSVAQQRFLPAGGVPRHVSTIGNAGLVAVAWVAGFDPVVPNLPPAVAQVALDLRSVDLNARDADQLQRGYYENLTGSSARTGQLWDLYAQRSPNAPGLKDVGVLTEIPGPLHTALVPYKAVVVDGASFRTNRWGMRDQDYDEAPPAGTYRTAILGQSYVLGMGVGDREVFEAIVERRLDAARRASDAGGFEMLNFAMPRWSLAQQAFLVESGRVKQFAPQAAVVVGNRLDFERLIDWVYVEARAGEAIPDSAIQAQVASLGIGAMKSSLTAQTALAPMKEQLARWSLTRLHAALQEAGIARPRFVVIPMPVDTVGAEEVALIGAIAREAGFEVSDLSNVYDGYDRESLRVAPWDRHPNAIGHQLIATRLEALLRPEVVPPPSGRPPGS